MPDSDDPLASPPRCLAGLSVRRIEIRCLALARFSTAFAIACPCGGQLGSVLGYPSATLNQGHVAGRELTSPLSFLCMTCEVTTPFFDSALHGYRGEMGSSAKPRGTGGPAAYDCPACAARLFALTLHFEYAEAAFDLLEDDPATALQDYFQRLSLSGTCEACLSASTIADLEL
ncbi:MAG: hypothetical protein ABI609_17090 [Acidobacteriota bacterium]